MTERIIMKLFSQLISDFTCFCHFRQLFIEVKQNPVRQYGIVLFEKPLNDKKEGYFQ